MYIADTDNSRIRKVDHSTGIITTFAGSGILTGDGVPATSAQLQYPQGLAFDSAGDLYISDTNNNLIRKVDHATGNISTFAGSGTAGFGGDNGPATSAALHYPMGIAFDPSGNLYIADESNHRIRKVDTGGAITTVVGDGTPAYNGDGILATSAELNWPSGIAFDVWNNLYIADQGNHRIRKVDAASGLISTVAGNGTEGYSGDGGPATSAEFDWPMCVSVPSSGNLYIADQLNNRIRKVTKSTGVVTTLAGTGVLGFSGDMGPAISAQLNWPVGVTFNGNAFYIVDQANNRIRTLSP
jgi:sugar lactone lactonase YvrE